MKKEFTNELVFKMELNNLIRSLNSNNPHTVYNIFCHHISDTRDTTPEEIAKEIMTKGLKCGYSTISRTLTFLGTSHDFEIDRIFKYSYTAKNHKNRTVVVLAIPKYIKLNSGEYVDFQHLKAINSAGNKGAIPPLIKSKILTNHFQLTLICV